MFLNQLSTNNLKWLCKYGINLFENFQVQSWRQIFEIVLNYEQKVLLIIWLFYEVFGKPVAETIWELFLTNVSCRIHACKDSENIATLCLTN